MGVLAVLDPQWAVGTGHRGDRSSVVWFILFVSLLYPYFLPVLSR
jgi:hypothetical protein